MDNRWGCVRLIQQTAFGLSVKRPEVVPGGAARDGHCICG